MESNMGQPKQYTPGEMAQLEKSRTISDAELLKGGAEYVVGEEGEKRLQANKGQIKEFQKEFKVEEIKKEINLYRSAIGRHMEEIKKDLPGFLKRNELSVRTHIVFQPWVNHNYEYGGVYSLRDHAQIEVPKKIISETGDIEFDKKTETLEFGSANERKLCCGLYNVKSIKSDASGEVFDIEKIVREGKEE